MAIDSIRLAGDHEDHPVVLAHEDAAGWLLGDDKGVTGYNRTSVRLYDFAGYDDLGSARSDTLRDRITFSDLGRMTCLAASLRYKRAHSLMALSSRVDWPEHLPRLDDLPSADSVNSERVDEFVLHDGVRSAHQLFRALKDNKEYTGLGSSTISKLLHLKWPAFFPIADSLFRKAYGRRAARIHTASEHLKGSARSDGNIRAYWYAFRCDLARNREALAAMPSAVARLADGDAGAEAHAARLAQLEPLRLLDMLAWKVGATM